MGFDLGLSVSVFTVFIQGLLSFFSPCVVPLVPLYLGYLAGGAAHTRLTDRQRRIITLRNTLFFIAGISFAFFALGLGFSSLGQLFSNNRQLIARIGGVLVFLLGLYQTGFLKLRLLQKERRLPFALERFGMNPLTALALGFTFSFAWTPCVGPALTSVLLMAGSSSFRGQGFGLIGVYTLGFVLPFLLVGLFTSQVLSFLKKHRSWLAYTAKAGGVLLMAMGVMMFTGWMNGLSGYLSGIGQEAGSSSSVAASQPDSAPADSTGEGSSSASSSGEDEGNQEQAIPAPDFTLVDQYGNSHTLSDYQGKTVFLNFWATWCGPCQNEMPDIQHLYQDWGENTGDVIVLGIAAPYSEQNPYNQEQKNAQEIAQLLEQKGYTYPTLMDETGEIFAAYGIQAYPTTFMIDAEGNVFGYLPGAMSRAIMDSIVEQTQTGVRASR